MMRRWRLLVPMAAGVALAAWIRCGPLPEGLLDLQGAESMVITDRSGEVLYEARSDQGSRTTHLTADRLPPALVAATLAAEDHRFYRHPGVDPIAVIRAAAIDLRHMRAVEGGSTITQQVAKLLLARRGPSSRGVLTKATEAVVALRLEHRLSKQEILALYLNLASYGNQLVGAERASQAYFDCGAALLTTAQAAFVASLPQRPTAFNPYRNAESAHARQLRVVDRLAALGWITPDGAREAREERLVLHREPATFIAPHFVARILSERQLRRSPIVTTLDAELQRTVLGIIRAERPALDRAGAHNVAVVVLDNQSGEWLAWEGSGDYTDRDHGGAIDGVVTPRQPGSALKPFTYALAFEEGDTPASALPDVPSFFPTAEAGIAYSPKNYDGQFRGPMLARHALAGSENVPAVALASRVGVASLVRFFRRAGLTTFDRTAAYYGLGVTLGDGEVRLDQMVAAYAAFARGGRMTQPRLLRRPGPSAPGSDGPSGRGSDGSSGPGGNDDVLVTSRTAFWISDILSDADARAYAFGRGGSLEFPFAVAAKTGTSQAYRDNWAIGYTRHVTVGVWVGNFDRTPLVNSSGVTGAGPIFHAVLLAAERRVTGGFPGDGEPATAASADGLERRAVCAMSGLAATAACPSRIEEWLPAAQGLEPCTWHRRTHVGVVVDWPPEYRQWAGAMGLTTRAVHVRAAHTSLQITNPPPSAIYLIDPTLRRPFQTLALRTAGSDARVDWRVDGELIGTADGDASFAWPLRAGRHTITATDAHGSVAETMIVVK